ncbi:hypothetical protein GA0074692_0870 [Micromonospora pallida]|uniref:MarR family transcriptional regulator n=1 Tax=Micromonospora pallida TaxID=145854 RepID=A0A1C6RT98_9ACTN|nr:MarR family winged helix-turn-helix transcriptional regulator [Micromonospora pallida]SCL20448.1 hypothetical protein GA0074692_0870 [Micromonospora pallida]
MIDSTKTPSTLERVLTALAELGPATAASIGESVGIAYPTTTPKLRELESAGHAERVRAEQRTTLWQLTETGKAAAASVVAGSTSTQLPPAASTGADDPAWGESQQRADLRPEAEPEPGAGAPAEGQTPGKPPADQQTGDSTADAGQASPTPTEAAGPAGTVEQADTPQAEPEPGPMTGLESESAPETDPPASSSTTRDQPAGEPRADDRVGGLATDSTARGEHQAPAVAGPETGTQERDGRRKPAQPRRRKGELRDEVLALLQRNPDTAYKVGEICKLINQARDGAQVNKASAGAVANALDKLVIAGNVTRLDTKVATYQAN